MWSHGDPGTQWRRGTAKVDGNLESDLPTWVMTAVRGRTWRLDICGGGMATRPLGEAAADLLNGMEPERWDWWIEHRLRGFLFGWY
jgi:hypothetical protein